MRRDDFNISGALAHTPFPPIWDGPLYTLAWELGCYGAIAVLVLLPVGPRLSVTATTIGIGALVWLHKIAPAVVSFDLRLPMFFAAGALLYVWRHRVVLNAWTVGGSLLLTAVGLVAGGLVLAGAVPFTLLALWIAARFPTRFASRNDLSYGVYVYAWPVQQMFVSLGLHRQGLVPYLVVVLAVTIVLAAASWFGLERSALRLKRLVPGKTGAAQSYAASRFRA